MRVRGEGSAIFAATLLLIIGTLNIVYGIANISDANFYSEVTNADYLFGQVHTWGWIGLILGVIELLAGFSLFGGGGFGRFFGIFAATFGAIGALFAINDGHPFWSLAIFAVCIIVIHGLVVLGEPVDDTRA